MNKTLFFLIFLFSCSSTAIKIPADSTRHYNYQDVSGDFKVTREMRTVNKKVVNRTLIKNLDGNKLFEKSIMVSQPGSIKSQSGRVNTFRPIASDYEVWLDGKLNKSSLRMDVKSKSLRSIIIKPTGQRVVASHPFPKHQQFCFYNQIRECLIYNGILSSLISAPKRAKEFFVVWDMWPYHQEMLNGISSELFTKVTARNEGKDKDGHRIVIEIAGQIILYHFSSESELVKMAWVAQGITLLPLGQKISSEME